MHRSEEWALRKCADCGVEFGSATQPGFSFGTRSALCFECAMQRGGSYDAPRDDWTVSPRLDGLEPYDGGEGGDT
jgi:hypothetical protein